MEKQVTACFKVPESDYREFRAWVAREGLQLQEALLSAFREFMVSKNIAKAGDEKASGR
jgi:hypothetical protein